MKEIYAETRISRRDIVEGRYRGASLRDSVVRDLARSLAEQLLKTMELRERIDPETGDLFVRAGVYVAEGGERVREMAGSRETFEVPRMTATEISRREGMKYVGSMKNDPMKFEPSFMTEMMIEPPPEPSSLTEAKMKEAIDSMRRAAQEQTAKFFMAPLFMEQLRPLSFMDTRMERKKAQQDGEVAALLKARGEKEVRERTKRRGVELKIEVGVRKITMPEEKKETG